MPDDNAAYLAREAKARVNIDKQLEAAGWIVQNMELANVVLVRALQYGSSFLRSPTGEWTTYSVTYRIVWLTLFELSGHSILIM